MIGFDGSANEKQQTASHAAVMGRPAIVCDLVTLVHPEIIYAHPDGTK